MDSETIKTLYRLYLQSRTVCTDTRKMVPGALFFALRGDRFDGNTYAAQALEAGASACVVDDPVVAALNDRFILADDTLTALQELALYHRLQLGIPFLAITGSNGKTTTKELVSRVLAKKFRVSVTQGNLNNHIGVPLTILAIPEDAEFAVIEMGANHRGEIRSYCSVACPDFGLITNIGKAHIGEFGGMKGIVAGKGELFDFLSAAEGTAFVLKDNGVLSEMAAARPGLKTIPYTAGGLTEIPSENNHLTLEWNSMTIGTHLIGSYNTFNIAAAIAVGQYFGIADREIREAIESYLPDNARSQRIDTGKNILYMDAYNANPSSMEAAVDNFARTRKAGYSPALILGDMRELGEFAEEEHRRVLDSLRKYKFENVFLVGENFAKTSHGTSYLSFATVRDLYRYLKNHPLTGKVILIKGSRGERLEIVKELL